jgi:two-component system KDP operon response regulator KdpE
MSPTRILVADDEPSIRRVLRRAIAAQGYEVQVAGDGEEALALFRTWSPDLVVTDLAMPGLDGLELCRRLRKVSAVPVIVLSVKGDERAKVEALNNGADDYVTKPFGMEELLARIRAGLRRASHPPADQAAVLAIGDFVVEQSSRTVKVRGDVVRLTPKEYDLLLYFLNHPGRVLTHRVLLGAIWGGDAVEQSEYLRVFIGQLRKKIELHPAKPEHIVTDPWVGYLFHP